MWTWYTLRALIGLVLLAAFFYGLFITIIGDNRRVDNDLRDTKK